MLSIDFWSFDHFFIEQEIVLLIIFIQTEISCQTTRIDEQLMEHRFRFNVENFKDFDRTILLW